jgi:ribose transport system substrate-binding protein
MVRRAMDDGVDVIIFSAVDYNANAEIIDQAAQRGIKIIVIDSDVNSSQVSCRIGTNNLQAGIKAAEAALATDDEELYIGIVNYDVNSANGQQRELGFRQTVEQDPRVKNITTINVLSTTEDARAGAKEMLLSDSRINVVVTFNEWTSLGVGWAIRDLNRADRIQVVAFDSNVVSVGMLETGEVDALIVQNPYAMGYLGVETAANLMNGQTGGPSVVDTATTIVTRENMYEPESQKILFSFEEEGY